MDDTINQAVISRADDKKIACADAFRLALKLEVSPDRIGKAADATGVRLTRCQLGFFGQKDVSTVTMPVAAETRTALKTAINELSTVHDGRISCSDAWALAERHQVPKIYVATQCDQMDIRIKPCQLGAF